MPSRLTTLKPGQGEGDCVCPGPQVDDLVLTRAVGDDRPDLLDESRAGRLDGHPGQDGAGGILDDCPRWSPCARATAGTRSPDSRTTNVHFDRFTPSSFFWASVFETPLDSRPRLLPLHRSVTMDDGP